MTRTSNDDQSRTPRLYARRSKLKPFQIDVDKIYDRKFRRRMKNLIKFMKIKNRKIRQIAYCICSIHDSIMILL